MTDDPKLKLATRPGDELTRMRADIAETRAQMGGAIEELHGRLNPTVLKEQAIHEFHDAKELIKVEVRAEIDDAKARLKQEFHDAKTAVREATIGRVENMVESAQDTVRETGHSIVDTIKQNPIPVALATIGVAWLFMSARSRRSSEAQKLKAGETAGAALPVQHGAMQPFHDNPLAVGVAVVALGTAIGLAIPTTRRESRVMGEARDQLVAKGLELANDALEKVDDASKHSG